MRRAVVVAMLLACAGGAAHADDRPWAQGVSEDEQAKALELYQQGNEEFALQHYVAAKEKYEAALTHWDHPAIHFNLAAALIGLKQFVDAKVQLDASQKYGEAGVGADLWPQVLTNSALLDSILARVHIACREPGATVSLDGHVVFVGPGMVDQVAMPGEHQILATKTGFITQSESVTLTAGQSSKYDVRLIAFKAAGRVVRRWTPWKPWVVVGAGAVVAGLGVAAHVVAAHNIDTYDQGIDALCPHGCTDPTDPDLIALRATRDRGHHEQDVAVALWAVGGAAAIVGVIGVVLNLPRTEEQPRAHPVVTPMVGGGLALGLERGF